VRGAVGAHGPGYPFAETRYWTRFSALPAATMTVSPHWGRELKSPAVRGRVFECERSTQFPAYLDDHRLYGTVVVPATSHLATVLSAVAGGGEPLAVEDLYFPRPLVLTDDQAHMLQILVGDEDSRGGRSLSVQSPLEQGGDRWVEHVTGRIVADAPPTDGIGDRDAFQESADGHVTGDEFYAYFRGLGYTLGRSFRWIADVWTRGDEALVRLVQPPLPDDVTDYEVYPGLIDSCFQSTQAFLVRQGTVAEADALGIPLASARMSFHSRPLPGQELWCHVRAVNSERLADGRLKVETADLRLVTSAGAVVMAADSFRVREAPRSLLERGRQLRVPHTYETAWVKSPVLPRPESIRTVVVYGAGARFASELSDALREAAVRARVAEHGEPLLDEPADLVVDARFLATGGLGGDGSADAVLDAAVALAETVRSCPVGVTYAVLGEDDPAVAPVTEALAGLLAAAEAEDGERRAPRITLTEGWSSAALADLLAALADRRVVGPRFALGRELSVARLVPARPAEPPRRDGGGALITGGLGALGLSVARMLGDEGVRALTLVGRSAPDAGAQRVIDDLRADGVNVSVVSGDVEDPAACAEAVRVAAEQRPLTSVFHLAGAIADGSLASLERVDFAAAFGAKARGAERLLAAVESAQLAEFVLFSSVSSVLGSAGQTNYAAANGYLNGLARMSRAHGLPVTSIAWGPWTPEVKRGMAGSAAAVEAAERQGVRPLSDDDAAAVLGMVGGAELLVGVALDVTRYHDRAAGSPRAALVSGLLPRSETGAADSPDRERGWLRSRLADCDPVDLAVELRSAIRAQVADVAGRTGEVDDEAGFAELGLDSIMVIDLRSRLAHALDAELPATVAIDHPTVSALAAYVATAVFAADTSADDGTDPYTSDGNPDDPGSLSLADLLRSVRDELDLER
jgi:NAD(P)-dependent dehydrogenase (short-subunit alcohol dehydrogenase family)/acyl carrier protein